MELILAMVQVLRSVVLEMLMVMELVISLLGPNTQIRMVKGRPERVMWSLVRGEWVVRARLIYLN